MTTTFGMNPRNFIEGVERERAQRSLRRYLSAFTGRHFERFIAQSDPTRFTPNDMLAVSALSVDVPIEVAVSLLEDRGGQFGELLSRIPADQAIWDESADLGEGSPALELWHLLRPEPGVGRVITSKLLAAKRPHLLPIYDSKVGQALLAHPDDNDWAAWRNLFRSSDGAHVRDEAKALAAEAGSPQLAVLRVMDIVVWMRVHGWRSAGDEFADFENPIGRDS